MAGEGKIAFRLDRVGFGYDGRPVLTDLSLDLAAGRFTGLVGPNGAGKTTLLDLLAGLKRPDRGKVLFRDRDVSTMGRLESARVIGLVPQEFRITMPFTVRQVTAMGRHPHQDRFSRPGPEDEAAVEAALTALDLLDLAERPVTELSGGEKQRAAAARALAQEPEVFLLDEPTASLDIRHSLTVLELIAELVAQGRTAVAVMHDLNLAAAYCRELILLKDGRILAAGPTEEVLTRENIAALYGVAAKVRYDDFVKAPTVLFRPAD